MRRAVPSGSCACVRPLVIGTDPRGRRRRSDHRGEPTIAGEPLAVPRAAGDADRRRQARRRRVGRRGRARSARRSRRRRARRRSHRSRRSRGSAGPTRRCGSASSSTTSAPVAPFGRDDVDPHVWGKSSGIELMLQPGDPGDNRDYYELQVDVGGAVFDSHFDDYNAPITRQRRGASCSGTRTGRAASSARRTWRAAASGRRR